MNKGLRLLARWERGKHWVELYENRKCYFVKYDSAFWGIGYQHFGHAITGNKFAKTDEEAIAWVQHDIDTNFYLPMFAKIPMEKVV